MRPLLRSPVHFRSCKAAAVTAVSFEDTLDEFHKKYASTPYSDYHKPAIGSGTESVSAAVVIKKRIFSCICGHLVDITGMTLADPSTLFTH